MYVWKHCWLVIIEKNWYLEKYTPYEPLVRWLIVAIKVVFPEPLNDKLYVTVLK